MGDGTRQNPSEPEKRLRYHLVKGNYFRVLHVDGAFGGITPRGNLAMALFNERGAIPQVLSFSLDEVPDSPGVARIGEEIESERVGKDGMVRELDAELIMSIPVAASIASWIISKVSAVDKTLAKRVIKDIQERIEVGDSDENEQ